MDSTKVFLTQKEKESNDFQWYKENIDRHLTESFSSPFTFGGVDTYNRKKVNYDLFNNIIDMEEFKYVCKPYGSDDVGELPANLINRDIVSSKIKILLGLEMKRPFSWKVYAVNEEATSRKEQVFSSMIREFVVNSILTPLKQKIVEQHMAEMQGQQLNPQQQKDIEQQIEEELKAATPEEVKRYMEREHQDPAEVLAHQILEYILQKEDVRDKFNLGWKHAMLTAEEIYYVGIVNGQPVLRVVNPLNFSCDRSTEYIEDGDWFVYDMWMSPSEIVNQFSSMLTKTEIQDLHDNYGAGDRMSDIHWFNNEQSRGKIRVSHAVFRGLRKIGFLVYEDETGQQQNKLVDENYILNPVIGDISIKWEWIPEKHEGYKIGRDIYKQMQPLPNQLVNLSNLYEQKGPYYGGFYDSTNSVPTSPMDRMKSFQFYLNIIFYRLELLMASDKGKILMMNINAIPKSMGIDLAKFEYMIAANKIAYVNPNEEGNRSGTDATTLAKEVDMSLASDIKKYLDLAEYIERKCGETVGITQQMEGQISASEAVNNTRQAIVQSGHVLEPLFEYHNIIKKNVLTALLETCKIAYTYYPQEYLHYVLDDMSLKMLKIDADMLSCSDYGLFVTNSGRANEVKQVIEQLAHAALQNQTADLSDIIKVIRFENIEEAEEQLMVAESKKRDAQNAMQREQIAAAKEAQDRELKERDVQRQHEKDLVVLKETERRETEVLTQTILSMGFNEDKDLDKDGMPDVLEIAKYKLDADIKQGKLALEKDKLNTQKKMNEEKVKLEREKIKANRNKPK